MSKILIIDDDHQICNTLVKVFMRMDHEVDCSFTLEQGLNKIFTGQFDIVFLDVNLPDGNGLDAIEAILEHPFAPEVIIMTGAADSDEAELAMESKAWDYIQKSGSYKKFKFSLNRALEYRSQKRSDNHYETIERASIIGNSPQILKCLDKVSTAANNDLPILITGETGTGKELFSRAIHDNSKRSSEEFVVVDCTALPEHLIESTLFGHTKGAFTGADFAKKGLIELADKGTLFLDEVGELPLSIQKKFLRALQEKKIRPVGGSKEIKSDFRLICATHRDLSDMVKENKFREDLFFRMFSINIHLPLLKDRINDIKVLSQYHLSQCKKSCTMSREFLEEIEMYEWPGNVRELLNTIDLICSNVKSGSTLFPHHLPGHIRAVNIRNKFKYPSDNQASSNPLPVRKKKTGVKRTFKEQVEKTKYEYLQDVLSTSKGNLKEACRISGLSRSQLYRLMDQYHLKD